MVAVTEDVIAARAARPRDPAGPRGWPLVGSIPEIRKKGTIGFLEEAWRGHGDVFRVNMGMKAVCVAHPLGIARVLADNRKNYVKGSTYDGVRRIIGNGVLTLEGHEWRKRRSLMQPSFHRAALADMARIMVETTAAFLDKLHAELPEDGAPLEIDAHRHMVALALDVVVGALFGRDLGGVGDVSYESLGAALELVSSRANGISLPEWIPTAGNRRMRRVMNELEGAVMRVIAAGRKRLAAHPEGDGTLLTMLLQSVDADTGAPLTDREVRDEVFTLFVAGHETTALTLTWMFTLLEGEDDLVARMRQEVDDVVGARAPAFDDVPRLGLLRRVVDETLRLRGPVAVNVRTAVADDVILGRRIHAGDFVMPFFWGVHRHPDFWTDPERFDPDRFTEDNKRARPPWCYLPFSGGQRICIGNNFSLLETVLIVAMMLQRFDVRMVPGQRIDPMMIATVRPSSPVKVLARRRGAGGLTP